jgi:hypothetical protein
MSAISDIASLASTAVVASGLGAWVLSKWQRRRETNDEIERVTWHGYIELSGINSWPVRLMEHPDHPTARVVVEVVDGEGAPDVNWAQNLRQHIEDDGLLTRAPSAAEYAFLQALHKERGYGEGEPIR